MIKKPSVWIPAIIPLIFFVYLVVYITIFGIVRKDDEVLSVINPVILGRGSLIVHSGVLIMMVSPFLYFSARISFAICDSIFS